jgi:hypothetical protein
MSDAISRDIQDFGIDIVSEENKTILHRKVAARVVCVFSEQDVQITARAESHQKQHGAATPNSNKRRHRPCLSLCYPHLAHQMPRQPLDSIVGANTTPLGGMDGVCDRQAVRCAGRRSTTFQPATKRAAEESGYWRRIKQSYRRLAIPSATT